MIIHFTTQPDRKLLGAALRRAFRTVMLLPYWVVGALTALMTMLTLCGGDGYGAAIPGTATALLGVVYWRATRRLVGINWKFYGVPIAWTIDGEGVRTASEPMDSLVRWPALERVEPIPAHLIFRIGRYQVLPARVDGLDAGQLAELLAFLHVRGLLKEEPEKAARRISRA